MAGSIRITGEFQVVPPCGGHPQKPVELLEKLVVSSRAPVWGASFDPDEEGGGQECFKSCPRVGGIAEFGEEHKVDGKFQVVPPCGGHRAPPARPRGAAKFQVVPPCGGHL